VRRGRAGARPSARAPAGGRSPRPEQQHAAIALGSWGRRDQARPNAVRTELGDPALDLPLRGCPRTGGVSVLLNLQVKQPSVGWVFSVQNGKLSFP